MRKWSAPLLLIAMLGVSGCVVISPGDNPYPPVPVAKAEAIPKPPVSEEQLIWQPGHWDWLGRSYVWTAGQWVPRAGHGANWQGGYWSTAPNGQWIWIAPHWL